MQLRRAGAILAVALLVGCGGGGGGGGGGGSPPPPGGSGVATALGARAVPGFRLEASSDLPSAAGAVRTVTVTATPDAGSPAAVTVEAAVTAGPAPAVLVAGTPVAGVADTWNWRFTVPADLSAQRVVVRIRDAAGNSSETGISDFPLAP